MANILGMKKVLKYSAGVRFRTPLLLKSGKDDVFSDSTIEKTYDGKFIHINGYVWASLIRRCLARLKNGLEVAERIGKYNDGKFGVSQMWCEPSFISLSYGLHVRYGNAVDRKYGSAKEGALFSDEITPSGLSTTINWNYFVSEQEDEKLIKTLFIDALKVASSGIENVGGGWSYGFGRMEVKEVKLRILDLSNEEDLKHLWRYDDAVFKEKSETFEMEKWRDPSILKPWISIRSEARIVEGQLLSVANKYPTFNEIESLTDYPDSFVYRGYVVNGDGKVSSKIIIPGRTLRQAIFSVEIERKLRTRNESRVFLCDSLAGSCTCYVCEGKRRGNKNNTADYCLCSKCNWFGSTDRAGIISVLDAPLEDVETVILNRIQLCEHSVQNINLFSTEYVKKGKFNLEILIDLSEERTDPIRLKEEVLWVLEQMKNEKKSPKGWIRIGASSTATGQLEVLSNPLITEWGPR
ncbi:MAG: hypothetical protein N2513_09635 [Deltaproteobacteria bacterium]|nr:hypothetical protein [Deltaproteobacteria bacterium]